MYGPAARMLPFALSFFSSLCIMVLELVASRLVARHVGASLTVWTSVIGIMLAGICAGNVLGGRLADRIEPRRAIGPLYALGSALCLSCLWINAAMGPVAGAESLPWDLRTVLVVTLDFLVPATVLGMISPVVAKMAVESSGAHRGARDAVVPNLVLALAAIGLLIVLGIDARSQLQQRLLGAAPISGAIEASLVFFAFAAIGIAAVNLLTARHRQSGTALGEVYFLGAVGSIVGTFLAGFWLIYQAPHTTIVTLVGAAYAVLAAALLRDRVGAAIGLGAAAFLVLGSVEPMTQGRSLAVPGIVLGTVKINALALVGQVAALALGVFGLVRLVRDAEPQGDIVGEEAGGPAPRVNLRDLAALSFVASLAFMALEMVAGRLVTRHLGSSVFGWTSVIGVLLGGLSLGNYLGGKVADRAKGQQPACWLFLVGSVLTLLVIVAETPPLWLSKNAFTDWLMAQLGAPPLEKKGALLSHAITMSGYNWSTRVLFWTGVVFLLPALAMGTISPLVAKLAVDRVRASKRTGAAIGQVYAWGMVGSIVGTFLTGFVLIDVLGTKGVLLVLATLLALAATALGSVWHAAWAGIPLGLCVIAFFPTLTRGIPFLEKPRAFLADQGIRWGIREESGSPDVSGYGIAYADESNYYYIKVTNEDQGDTKKRTLVLDNLIHGYFILGHPEQLDYDYEHIYALVTRRVAEAKAKAGKTGRVERVPLSTLFLGGGSYTFPRHLQSVYPGTQCEVAEIDPAVTRANFAALGLDRDTPIRTTWGDARQYVTRNQGRKQFDLVFGDAFNDFSVPWHLTTKEFNDKIRRQMSPDGVYMINIIDIYQSDERAEKDARAGKPGVPSDPEEAKRAARKKGGFLGSWVETARETFPYIYVFGTDSQKGHGLRETFVVVASLKPLDLTELGKRSTDPRFVKDGEVTQPEVYSESDMKELKVRAHGIRLTDDYAPVENLLAPVAESRGEPD